MVEKEKKTCLSQLFLWRAFWTWNTRGQLMRGLEPKCYGVWDSRENSEILGRSDHASNTIHSDKCHFLRAPSISEDFPVPDLESADHSFEIQKGRKKKKKSKGDDNARDRPLWIMNNDRGSEMHGWFRSGRLYGFTVVKRTAVVQSPAKCRKCQICEILHF